MINKLVNNWKLIAVGLLVLIAVIGIYFAFKNYNDLQAIKQQGNLIVASKTDFADTLQNQKTDISGRHHLTAPAGQHTFLATTITQNTSVSLGGADTAALALKIQRDQIEYWQQIAMLSQGAKLKALKLIDSLKQKVLFYKDKYIEIAYHPGSDTSQGGTFDYKNNDILTILQYHKKNWFLGQQHSFIDISSNNPNTYISGLKTLTIQQPAPVFNFKAQVKAYYDLRSGRVIPAAGMDVDFGHLEFNGQYYYSIQNQKFQPLFSAAYNFFKLH